MARTLSSNMYGADDNDFAQRIASESLGGQPNDGAEDYWMGCSDLKDGSDDVAKSNVGEESRGPLGSAPKLKGMAAGNFGDKEKFQMPPRWNSSNNKHLPGPTKSTEHGWELKHVPKNHLVTTKTDNPQTDLYNRSSQSGKKKGS